LAKNYAIADKLVLSETRADKTWQQLVVKINSILNNKGDKSVIIHEGGGAGKAARSANAK